MFIGNGAAQKDIDLFWIHTTVLTRQAAGRNRYTGRRWSCQKCASSDRPSSTRVTAPRRLTLCSPAGILAEEQ